MRWLLIKPSAGPPYEQVGEPFEAGMIEEARYVAVEMMRDRKMKHGILCLAQGGGIALVCTVRRDGRHSRYVTVDGRTVDEAPELFEGSWKDNWFDPKWRGGRKPKVPRPEPVEWR